MSIDFLLTVFFIIISLYVFYLGLRANIGKYKTVIMSFIILILASATFFSVTTYRGFPVNGDLPIDKQELLFAVVVPPANNTDGAIYLWLKKSVSPVNIFEKILFRMENRENTPRAYQIPYTKESAKKINTAVVAKKSGMVVDVEFDGTRFGNRSSQRNRSISLTIIEPKNLLKK